MPRVLVGEPDLERLAESTPILVVVAGSTETSTIPGISIAGPTPEATLYTPTLDVEYLVAGRPLTLNVVPVAPNGVPTPAVITRSIVEALRLPVLVVDAGCRYQPRIPVARLPSAKPGGRIDADPALPRGTSKSLFEEARLLGRHLARTGLPVLVGETIPGGTTTAAALLEALGLPGVGAVSSSSPDNPKPLKRRVVEAALERLRERGKLDVFEVSDEVGDPVHVAAAGVAAGVMDAGGPVYLAGGTQMAAVAALLSKLGYDVSRTAILTTSWIAGDPTADIKGLAEAIGVPLVASTFSFEDTRFEGLKLYDRGYAKEGVGAGGALVVAEVKGLSREEVLRLVESEYGRLLSEAKVGRG